MRLLALAFVLLLSTPSWGGILVVKLSRGDVSPSIETWGTGSGGEFRLQFGMVGVGIDAIDANVNTSLFSNSATSAIASSFTSQGYYLFNSFCVELNENINLDNTWYKVGGNFFSGGKFVGFSGLSDLAFYGGTNVSTDQLEVETKNLVVDWHGGLITKDDPNANKVQNDIWRREGELGPGSYNFTPVSNDPNKVRVLNLFNSRNNLNNVAQTTYDNEVLAFKAWDSTTWTPDLKGNRAQDQTLFDGSLREVPPNVPEPATFALFGMGALAAGFYRARRGSKKA